jgi:maltose/moltooligosaccharide transporter
MGFALAIGASVCFFLGSIVPSIQFLFYFGAVAMLLAMGWTIITSPEPKKSHNVQASQEPFGVVQLVKEIARNVMDMHPEAKKLCFVNSLTWFGAQCMFVFLPLFIAHNIFATHDPTSPVYTASRQLTSTAWLWYYLVCLGFSLVISRLLRHFSMKALHTFGLLCMGCALFGLSFSMSATQVVIYMAIAGVGWATTMAIPFAWAARYSSEGKGGACLSVFNTYLAFTSFLANLVSGWLVTITKNDVSALLLAGGVALLSALLLQGVKEITTEVVSAETSSEMPEALPAT